MSATHALLVCSSLSLVSCSLVVISIGRDPTSATSRHLRLVHNLLLSGAGLSMSLIVYLIVAMSIDESAQQNFCNIWLPFPIYFFLCSFGWTILIAFKFRSSKSWFLSTENKIVVPLWVVWVISFILVIPAIIFDIVEPGIVSSAISTASAKMCVYNHTSRAGAAVDVITLQLPLSLTILINLYSYSRGLWALRDSPHSVLAKNMRRAGGYLFVLLFVFIPNIIYNYYSISTNSNSESAFYSSMAFCLSSLQGFLNVIVYVVSNNDMASWLYQVLSCKRPWEDSRNISGGVETSVSPFASKLETKLDPEIAKGSMSREDMLSRDSFSIETPAPATVATNSTKGILQSNKPARNWTVSNLDTEKFVRFGEVTTRYISQADRASISSNQSDPYRGSF